MDIAAEQAQDEAVKPLDLTAELAASRLLPVMRDGIEVARVVRSGRVKNLLRVPDEDR